MQTHNTGRRREQLHQQMQDGEALLLFAGAPPRKSADASYPFFANRNFYYLTGILQTDSVYLAVKTGEELAETLFVHPKSPMAERWHGRRLSTEEAAEQSGIENVCLLETFDGRVKRLCQNGCQTIWYDFDKFDTGHADAAHHRHRETIKADYPFLSFKNAYPAICAARTIKDETELAHIRAAMPITRDGIHAMMQAARDGMHEYQLEAVFNKVLADAGCRESAFANIVSAGRNNFYIHYEDPQGLLHDGDLVLTDVGARKHQYVNDISRAFPVNGTFSTPQKEVYNIALQVNKELMGLLNPGEVSFEDIEAHSKRRVGELLVEAGYLGADEEVSKYYWHRGTHHIGLDVHDVGPAGNPIQPGMVFTIDVGIYMEDHNIGFRVEDNVAITATGYEHLSAGIVREVDDIEAMCGRQ